MDFSRKWTVFLVGQSLCDWTAGITVLCCTYSKPATCVRRAMLNMRSGDFVAGYGLGHYNALTSGSYRLEWVSPLLGRVSLCLEGFSAASALHEYRYITLDYGLWFCGCTISDN
ncbi:hypothetical protein L873DRAFT_934785 [Choiromyces venosus 120613-1]|uniref:Uncharacterized protein n=1 Tax=Choiromyces venosus 120613-1 TaxID=1336337 RepID=A0A3N4JLU9_9PEZI|nr:hypothetical protein L873DRAFT_934785 [Choiromyces venosus 120613-1]